MTEYNIGVLLEKIMEKAGGGHASGVDGTYIAEVISVNPLTIKMHDQEITEKLFINPAYMLEASDDDKDIQKPFISHFATTEAYEFLKEFHERFVIKRGDNVIVHMTGASFYIAGKMVAV